MRKSRCVLTFVLILLKIKSYSQAKYEVGFQTDNDSYLGHGSDRYYTNGLVFYYRQALEIKNKKSSNLANKIVEIEAGQKMYTSKSGYIVARKDIDRPFAGHLYIASHLNLLYNNESSLKLSLQLGIIGKDSGAEYLQTMLHKSLGLYPPRGWEYQINNQSIVNILAEYNKLLLRESCFDFILSGQASLGSGFTGANVASTLRIGKFNQLFNSFITQSVLSLSKYKRSRSYELYFYYKPQISYVAYDASIQGNIFSKDVSDEKQVTTLKEPFIISHQMGIDYTNKIFTVGIAATVQTKESKTMVKPQHQWGTFRFSYLF